MLFDRTNNSSFDHDPTSLEMLKRLSAQKSHVHANSPDWNINFRHWSCLFELSHCFIPPGKVLLAKGGGKAFVWHRKASRAQNVVSGEHKSLPSINNWAEISLKEQGRTLESDAEWQKKKTLPWSLGDGRRRLALRQLKTNAAEQLFASFS